MTRSRSRKRDLKDDGDRVDDDDDDRNDGSHKTNSTSDMNALVQRPDSSSPKSALAAQPQVVANRFEAGYLKTGEKEVSLPLYKIFYQDWSNACKRIRHSEGPTYLVNNGKYPAELAFIELNLTYPMSTDDYTYLGLVGRSVRRTADATDDFYASQVTDDEALIGMNRLLQQWENREGGPFVDPRLCEEAEGEGLHLPWAHLKPSSTQRRRSNRNKDASKLDEREAFNVIPPHEATGQDATMADQPQRSDIWTRAPELMMTNLCALAPLEHRELFFTNDVKTYNALIATLYHPSVHIYNVALEPGVYPSRLCAEVTARFLRYYEGNYNTPRVKFESQFCNPSSSATTTARPPICRRVTD